jgi:hypothetical protein
MGQANDQHNQARGGIRSLTFYLAAQAEENKVLVLFEASITAKYMSLYLYGLYVLLDVA